MNQDIIDTIKNFMNLHQITKSKLIRNSRTEKSIINNAQMFILIIIEDNGVQTMSSICEHTGISNQQMTKLVDDLVKLGFLSRDMNQANRRENLVNITDSGKEFLQQKQLELVESSISQFGKFSDTELATLNNDIKEIISIINK